jgi:hypothetical protein
VCVNDNDELQQLRTALCALHFTPGNPYRKHSRIVQPIYGKAAFHRFQAILSQFSASQTPARRGLLPEKQERDTGRSRRSRIMRKLPDFTFERRRSGK